MRILWHSNAPWSCTGYGAQTALFAPRLNEAGHPTAVSAFYGLHGGTLAWDKLRVYPAVRDPYGNDILTAHAGHWFGGDPRGGLVVTLIDVWVLAHEVMRQLDVACWVPVDHDPAPPRVRDFFAQTHAIPLAMSEFGVRQLADFDPIYIPHGIDTTALCPGDRVAARDRLNVPQDAFVVGMVAANKGFPSRKSFAQAFEAFSLLRKTHHDAVLYLHTEANGVADGMNLPALLADLGVPPANVRFCDQYAYQCMPVNHTDLADTYRAMDVLLNPAMGEGFGVPIIEAQACGTPVIVCDHSAMPEVGKTGWHIGGTRTWTFQESWQITPDIGQILWALESAYDMAGKQRDAAREHALQYDVNTVMDKHWLPALAEIDRRLAQRQARELVAA